MKIRTLFTVILMVLLSSVLAAAAAAQTSGLKPLAKDASLASTRSWLAHSLHKAGTFKYSLLRNSVFDLSFNGCQMAFTSEVAPKLQSANWIADGGGVSNPSGGIEGPAIRDIRSTESILNNKNFSTPFSGRLPVRDRFTFDLGQIDPELTLERTFNLAGGEKKATYLIFFADEATVEVKTAGTREAELRRTVSVALRPEDAAVIKDGFHHAVQLCRAEH